MVEMKGTWRKEELNVTLSMLPVIFDGPLLYRHGTSFPRYRLSMDILLPQVEIPLPAVVFIPGGGFMEADRSHFLQQRLAIAAAGFVVAAIDYRLIPTGTYAEGVSDVKAAVRYLRAHAAAFHIDSARIALMGDSAGGYLAALAGASNGTTLFDNGDDLDQKSDVQAVVDLYGLSDLTRIDADYSPAIRAQHDRELSAQSLYVNGITFARHSGAALSSTAAAAAAANPLTYISSQTPPFLLMHGTDDRLVSPSQTALLYEALRRNGVAATYYAVPHAGHRSTHWYQPQITERIIAFLQKHLGSFALRGQ
ncbi:alpha/beta hydrolase [Megasphaera vaginalis (ex Srinivasan et al. 2021)]|uniref:Peptidase, S9A/B/C family, catalytic domain protein n=1 Tax=Megasphaera vaginalis (ex Srinivasan et al. 2021) TaxID=1111454 RepID=U7UIJ5_9FIRM|nr:alpha/beta hydrolase [Megasphaera vaginalis (ex Srinivasan et al. 2021)]ERT59145.1 peptidase, S9A/B/C family, catalytic domain protein [Megasphaera vaginalis (ex Srinivasan et al. 2021)]